MSDGHEEHGMQSPADLATMLAEMLADAVPADALRRLEPDAAFSVETMWRHANVDRVE